MGVLSREKSTLCKQLCSNMGGGLIFKGGPIFYSSKLMMKKLKSRFDLVTQCGQYWNVDVYYPAKYGSLCSFGAETFST